MTRTSLCLTITLLATAASGQAVYPPNYDYYHIRDNAKEWQADSIRPRPPLPQTEEQLMIQHLLMLIQIAREALNPDYASAKRMVFARDFLSKTDPAYPAVDLGGNGVPP